MKDDQDNGNIDFKEAKDHGSSAPVNITVSGDPATDSSKNDSSEARIVTAPSLILGGIVVFPYALTPLVLNDPGTIGLMESASSGDRPERAADDPQSAGGNARKRMQGTG